MPLLRPFLFPTRRSYFLNHKLTPHLSNILETSSEKLHWKPLPSSTNPTTPKLLIKSIAELSKFKLSALVVLTTMSGHIMATVTPAATNLSPSSLGLTLTGTALCSFAANSLNQWAESALDAQMPRTQNRPLPRLLLTPFAAFNWAVLSGVTGLSILAFGVNSTSAGLAGLTILLYAGVYTPLKRISIVNTWIGALVGAIPPLIGWTAVTPSPLGFSAFILPAVLFCWQFPHFNALSWNLRAEYARAGYRMASVLNPNLNTRVALRYALALVPITVAATAVSLTTPMFMVTGNLTNSILIFQAVRFWRNPERKTARGLFFASLIHLPLFMLFLFLHRKTEGTPEIIESAK